MSRYGDQAIWRRPTGTRRATGGRGQTDRVRGQESPAAWATKQRGAHAVTLTLYRNVTPLPASHAGMVRGRT